MKLSLAPIIFTTIILSSCAQVRNYLPTAPVEKTKVFKAAWTKELDPISDSGNLPISLQSPAIDDGILYVGDNRGRMNAYELSNGRMVWSTQEDTTFHSAPVVYKDKVIYGTVQGRVIARNVKDGDKIYYNVDLGAAVETAGTIVDGKILFQLRNHQIFCLDVETGKIIWGFKKSVPYLTTLQRASTPVVLGNKVFVGFADGTLGAISLDEGVLLYETKLTDASKFVDVDSTPVFLDNKIYIGPQSSNVTIVEPNSGKILRKGEFNSLRAPLVVGDKLVYGTSNGEIVLCDKNLTVLNKVKVSNSSLTSLVKFKNYIVAGNLSGELLALDKNSFQIVEKFEFGHAYSAIFSDIAVKVDPATNKEFLSVMSSRNRLFTFN